jgi:hypothetical protein
VATPVPPVSVVAPPPNESGLAVPALPPGEISNYRTPIIMLLQNNIGASDFSEIGLILVRHYSFGIPASLTQIKKISFPYCPR